MAANSNIRMSIYMSKANITIEECITDLKEHKVNNEILEEDVKISNIEGKLVIGKTKEPVSPPWITFCEKLINKMSTQFDIFKNIQVSASAIFVFTIKGSKRCFIIVFGYGGKFLNTDVTEKNFGRNIVLNTADPQKIHSLRSKSYDGIPWYKEHQSAIPSNILQFELDTNYELVSRVTADASQGIPRKYFDKTRKAHENLLSNKFTGYDSLSLNSKIELKELLVFCLWLEETFKKDRYKKLVDNIDAFAPVKENSEISKHDNKLFSILTKIKSGVSNAKILSSEHLQDYSINIAPPDMIDHEELEGYQIVPSKYYDAESPFFEINLKNLVSKIDASKITKDKFKKIHLIAIRNGKEYKRWPLFKCIIAELKEQSETHVLFGGEWFDVDRNYIDKLIKQINSCVTMQNSTVPYISHVYESEDAYNKEQAKKSKFHNLDKKFLKLGGYNKLEIADLLYNEKHFIHVKRYGTSSGISHLSYQAINSTEMIEKNQKSVFAFLKDKLPSGIAQKTEDNIAKDDYNIDLLILHEKSTFDKAKKSENLSVFSIITLHKTMKSINQQLGRGRFKIHIRQKK